MDSSQNLLISKKSHGLEKSNISMTLSTLYLTFNRAINQIIGHPGSVGQIRNKFEMTLLFVDIH